MFNKQVMTPLLATCSPNDSLSRVLDLMSGLDASGLPVVDAMGRGIGVVTHDDIRRVRESRLDAWTVSDVMRSAVVAPQELCNPAA